MGMAALQMVSIALTVIVLTAMTVSAARLCNRLNHASRSYVLSCMLFPASQIACVAGIAVGTMAIRSEPVILFAVLALGAACIPLDSLLFTALGRAARTDALLQRARLLEAQIETQREGACGLASVANEARDIRRKMAEQLHELDEQLSRGEVSLSEKSVDDIIVLAARKSLRLCDHAALDALVSLKVRELKAKGIDVTCSLKVPAELSISDSELSAIVSNMLDNARQACERAEPAERFVIFKASVAGSYLVLDMRNSESVAAGDKNRETTRRGILERIRFAKEQTRSGSLAEHGWGLSVIDTIVQRYDGAVSLERTNGEFRMSVMVDLAAHT